MTEQDEAQGIRSTPPAGSTQADDGNTPAMTELTDDEPQGWADRHFILFAFLGAFGVLFHEAQWYTFTDYVGTTLATGGALLVLTRPTAIWRWALMHLGIVIEVLEKAPFSSNHTVFHAFMSAAMLATVLTLWVGGGFKPLTRDQVFRAVAPVGRVLILVLYFFTFWHKFNWGFLDPDVSCGVTYYAGLRDHLPFLPDGQWTIWPAIIGTLITEICLLVLLWFKPLRLFGLVFVLIFHGVVGSMLHPNFSAIAFGYLILFFPMECSGRVAQRWQALLKKVGVDWAGQREAWVKRLNLVSWIGTAVVVAWFVYVFAVILPNKEVPVRLLREPWNDPRNLLQRNIKRAFQLYGTFIFFAVYAVGLWGTRWTWPKGFFRFRYAWVYLFPVLMFAHGMGAYFGGRTHSAFNMFSNLITEPGYANHFVTPWTPHFTDLQRERVTILETDDPDLANFAERGFALHWFELKRYVQRKAAVGQGDFSVRYLTGENMTGVLEEDMKTGQLVEVDNASQDPALNQPIPYFLKKYMYLRPYKHGDRNTCGH